jgi:hypothetical protein
LVVEETSSKFAKIIKELGYQLRGNYSDGPCTRGQPLRQPLGVQCGLGTGNSLNYQKAVHFRC